MLHYDDSSRDDRAVEWFDDPRCTNGHTWLVLDVRVLAKRDRLKDVLDGLAAAAAATGLAPVKVNAVLMRGVNDDEAPALLRFCLARGYQLRFIEQMPLDAQHGWRADQHGDGR